MANVGSSTNVCYLFCTNYVCWLLFKAETAMRATWFLSPLIRKYISVGAFVDFFFSNGKHHLAIWGPKCPSSFSLSQKLISYSDFTLKVTLGRRITERKNRFL